MLIARALAPRPKLLLLDEPTANLDPLWQIRLMELVRTELGPDRAALVAVHDLDAALRYADRILVMDQGRIAAEGLDGPHDRGHFRSRTHRGRMASGQAAGGSAIIAVNSACAASLSPT